MTPILLLLVPLVCSVSCLPTSYRDGDNSKVTEVGNLSSKLQRLKAMLQELHKDEEQIYQQGSMQTKADTTAEITSHKEHAKSNIDVSNEAKTTDNDQIINMKKYVSSLSPRELEMLKVLKQLLDSKTKEYVSTTVDPGTFMENPVPASKEGIQIVDETVNSKISRTGTKLRESDDSTEYIDSEEETIPVVVEEESSESFRDELKHSVEKNLLTDIALAIHAGISVDELLEDIQNGEDDSKEDHLVVPPKKKRLNRD